MSAARQAALFPRRLVAAGGSLASLAAAMVFRHALEGSMAWHMLLQLPLIFLSGMLAAGAMPAGGGLFFAVQRRLRQFDEHGLPGLLAISFLLTYWMIPKTLEHTLVAPLAESAKFASLFLGGLILAGCLARANWIIQLFFLGNVAWMMAIVGLLYQSNATRLCNYYLLDDQVLAGQGLVLLSVALPALWLWRQMRRGSIRRLLS